MTDRPFRIYYALLPLACLYGMGVRLRNKLFDWGWRPSRRFQIPVICVGNLAVGGTGKTPHTEYLIRLLLEKGFRVATLSRGYKRHTHGYQLATRASDARQIGDEPYQMKHKFPQIQVAVDERRCRGIERLTTGVRTPLDVVLLDDAFQHRQVQAGLNIVLTDYHRLYVDDWLLPAGRLREPRQGIRRTQVVVVTKCPANMSQAECEAIEHRLHLQPGQQLYFSTLCYGALVPLYPNRAVPNEPQTGLPMKGHANVLLVTGIASPSLLLEEVKSHVSSVHLLSFSDHHDFDRQDVERIRSEFRQLKGEHKLIITTEKDAARLTLHLDRDAELQAHIYVLPVEVKFLQGQQTRFNQTIIDYVTRSHTGNGSLS